MRKSDSGENIILREFCKRMYIAQIKAHVEGISWNILILITQKFPFMNTLRVIPEMWCKKHVQFKYS